MLTRKMRMFVSLLLTALLLALSVPAYASPTVTPEPTLPPLGDLVAEYDENKPEELTVDQLYSQAAILINEDTGEVLLQKNADMAMNPASTTKIMTALLALEYGNINAIVTIPKEAADIPLDSSVVPVTVGEEMTFKDLLYGFMLKSGNDAGNAIAVIIAGSVDAFVDMMNERAAELGCTNTHFVNPHGYTAENHYTTARDMALITQEAMKHDIFRKIVSVGEYTMYAGQENETIVRNSNMLVTYGSKFRYKYATGVKTGTTSAAGQCLVGSATKGDINLISVVFKSTVVFPHAKWQDTVRMMEYGFAQYQTYNFDQLYEMLNIVVPISGAAEGDPSGGMVKLKAIRNRSGVYEKTILCRDLDALVADFNSRKRIEYTSDLVAPIEEGDILGRLYFTAEDGQEITAILTADRSVAAAKKAAVSFDPVQWVKDTIPGWVLILIGVFFLFLLILIISRAVVAAQERKRRRLARERARARKAAQARRAAQAKRQGQNPVKKRVQ